MQDSGAPPAGPEEGTREPQRLQLSLDAVIPLSDLRGATAGLDRADKARIVDEALLLFDGLYVHLPLKRAMHAVDPVQRLRLVRNRLSAYDDEYAFHREMLRTFNSVRDLHTNYVLPPPFHDAVAFLPFMVAECVVDGQPHVVVKGTDADACPADFVPGVEVLFWNGMPVAGAVAVSADQQAASNPAARHARGIACLTVRPLSAGLPPPEDWVVVTYASGGAVREARFPWRVFRSRPAPNAVDANDRGAPYALSMGLDAGLETLHRVRKTLFRPDAMRVERRVLRVGAGAGLRAHSLGVAVDLRSTSVFPDLLSFRPAVVAGREFGYLRIRGFDVWDVRGFTWEVVRILRLLPPHGLIIDVRGNPGGTITAGESLLQLFTNRRIEPEALHFIDSAYTQTLADGVAELSAWRSSIGLSLETGAMYSQGFPLEPADQVNQIGRVYPGPSVLVTDALCYGATDFFAAGFQDHEIGPILGVDPTTGAGGANVWTQRLLSQLWPRDHGPNPFGPLPRGAELRLAMRASMRVGRRAGLPLEDLGVVPDAIHRMTLRDVLGDKEDLIGQAASMLVGGGGGAI